MKKRQKVIVLHEKTDSSKGTLLLKELKFRTCFLISIQMISQIYNIFKENTIT